MKILRLLLPLLLLSLLSAPVAADRLDYDVDYTVQFLPEAGEAAVTIRITPGEGSARRLRLHMPESHYTQVRGEGDISRDGDTVTWRPLRAASSRLRFRYKVNNERRGGGFDARMTDDWVIVRGDDLVPRAVVTATKGSDSQARLRFILPKGWTTVDTPFLRTADKKAFVVVNAERNFDRPVGWIVAGVVGTRREFIGDTQVSVAGPKGDEIRRNDMLAFFNALVPEFGRAFGELPPKLLIVSADDPMWRGGLSGPRSLFLHADRPMISENGTSTLTHELTHVITRIRGAQDDDWIAEGLAEFYSIELLRRAGLLSEVRADKAQDWMANHGRGIKSLSANRSQGPRTARAVQLFRELDAEIRRASNGRRSLDDVTKALIPLREVSREDLREQAEAVIGRPSRTLATPLLD